MDYIAAAWWRGYWCSLGEVTSIMRSKSFLINDKSVCFQALFSLQLKFSKSENVFPRRMLQDVAVRTTTGSEGGCAPHLQHQIDTRTHLQTVSPPHQTVLLQFSLLPHHSGVERYSLKLLPRPPKAESHPSTAALQQAVLLVDCQHAHWKAAPPPVSLLPRHVMTSVDPTLVLTPASHCSALPSPSTHHQSANYLTTSQ